MPFAGLVYYLPNYRQPDFAVGVYDYNRLTDDWDQFFANHSGSLEHEHPFSFPDGQCTSEPGRASQCQFAADPVDRSRNDFNGSMGFVAVQFGRSFSVDAVWAGVLQKEILRGSQMT